MIKLPIQRLEALRDELHKRGNRRSVVMPSATPKVVEAMEILDEYGAYCEVMYLMMAADGKVLNVERKVLRGALDVLSNGRVKTIHMEAMIDTSSRRVVELGEDACLQRSIDTLRDDPVRAEVCAILAAAVAAADDQVTAEETALFERLVKGLGISEERVNELLDRITDDLETGQTQPKGS